ncbi:uncharacterized protein [Miscanthus floridulus]|uniref:uncharacterized protein isoform X1 n=1 Tax=Miscanthus floridulus TaxID=154761 RepID=UPI0034579EA5
MGNSCSGFPSKGTGRDDSGNSCLTADSSPFLLGKAHDPAFKWTIYGFSALFEREAIPASSASFDCCGYKWSLQVTLMHRKSGTKVPYVALCLTLSQSSLKPGYLMHALFELSIYNHSNGSYCGCKARYDFDAKKFYSKNECLITVEELLKSADFLVDDNCVFGVRILQADVSPKNNLAVAPDNTITIRELFLQKKEFIKGNYTWNVNNFLALKDSVLSPAFEACGHKWHIKMHPLGDQYSTDSLSMYLQMHDPAELSQESGKMFEVTLSILNQEQGQNYSCPGRLVFNGNLGWGWSDFIPLKILKDPSKGYLVASKWSVKADITCIGSTNDVQTPLVASLLKDEK